MANRVETHPWEGMMEPFKIFGNLYYVGTGPACTHVIDTGEGLIMLDSGYQESLYLVIANMYKMNLDPANLRYILHTHGHIDHCGATPALAALTSAKTGIAAADKTYVTGEENLSWADELELPHRTFIPDFVYEDGDVIELGNTRITCIATPGHTPGTTSFLFDVTDGEKTYTACLLGGIGFNSMDPVFLDQYGLTYATREAFPASMDRLRGLSVDIFLGNHSWNNDTPGKFKQLLAGKVDAFIRPGELAEYAEQMKADYEEMIRKEQRK